MRSHIPASVIVTTYNWPESLELVLLSICDQSVKPAEVIIADDGSGPETAQSVKKVLSHSGLEWCHARHDDRGVRQSRIKNLAVKYSTSPYLIFIDQDVLLERHFIADHLAMAEKGVFLQGKRLLLSRDITEKTLTSGFFKSPEFWSRGLGNRKNLFRSPFMAKMLSRPKKFETSLRGCNLSMFKSNFLEVDGFDETFDKSWGREDSDICYRLFHSGLKTKILWFSALQYHLKHRVVTNWDRERLDHELDQILKQKRVKAKKGFSQITPEGETIDSSKNFFQNQ